MLKNDKLISICRQFQYEGIFESVKLYGDGHINDTYKVAFQKDTEEPIHYILQRVNHLIFNQVEALMSNIENVTSYLVDMLTEQETMDEYEVLTLIYTHDKKSFFKDDEGNYWRSYVFVENATGHTFAEDIKMLYEAGIAFGKFQMMLKDYPVKSLYETIDGFHNTSKRLATFKKILERDSQNRSIMCKEEIEFVLQRQPLCSVILKALESQLIPYRVTHNDTKLNNVLLDDTTGKSRCVIDLDTVMPGSALFDYGDAIRSCASTAAEDEENLELLKLDFDRFDAYTRGFLETMGNDLTSTEIELLPTAAILMTFECGMRFLTDFLDGDKYFKVHRENHNLIRAKNQFKFVVEMEKQHDKMKSIIENYI